MKPADNDLSTDCVLEGYNSATTVILNAKKIAFIVLFDFLNLFLQYIWGL
jgi:hypothetical protein